jgi:hypothetical protein
VKGVSYCTIIHKVLELIVRIVIIKTDFTTNNNNSQFYLVSRLSTTYNILSGILMLTKLVRGVCATFDVLGQPLIIYCAFVKEFRKKK